MRLMLAVDPNEHAEELVTNAIRWAETMGRARLDLVYVDEHAYNAYLVQDPAVRTVLDREWDKVRDQLHQRLDKLLLAVPEPLRGKVEVRAGRPADEIVEAGKERDLVLIATHGRRGLTHALLGSVAERVVRLATVPVMVLRWPVGSDTP
ncbi:MAG: universal stress protein [Myxococcota bacterium]